MLGNGQIDFAGNENIRVDEVFRNMQRIRAHFRRGGAHWHGDTLVHVRRLYRCRKVLPDAIRFAIHIAGTTTRATMDSSGRFVGIVECPSNCTMGSIAGTSVRVSMVVGRRRLRWRTIQRAVERLSNRIREIILFCRVCENVQASCFAIAHSAGRLTAA